MDTKLIKKASDIGQFIRERSKQAAATSVKDPDEKGNPGEGADRDSAETKKSMPVGEEKNAPNKDTPKTVENENTSKGGEQTEATTPGGGTVTEPESPAKQAAKRIQGVLGRFNPEQKQAASKETAPDNAQQAPSNDGKRANEGLVNFDASYYVKLAQTVNASEERKQIVEKWASEDYGAEVAAAIIKTASQTEEELDNYEKQAAYERAYFEELQEKFANLDEKDRANFEKFASIQTAHLSRYKTELEKEAYVLGVKQAAAIMDQGGELPPETAEPSPEEIMALVAQMVEAGEITEEEAEAILAELEAGQMEAMPEEMKAASEGILKAAAAIA